MNKKYNIFMQGKEAYIREANPNPKYHTDLSCEVVTDLNYYLHEKHSPQYLITNPEHLNNRTELVVGDFDWGHEFFDAIGEKRGWVLCSENNPELATSLDLATRKVAILKEVAGEEKPVCTHENMQKLKTEAGNDYLYCPDCNPTTDTTLPTPSVKEETYSPHGENGKEAEQDSNIRDGILQGWIDETEDDNHINVFSDMVAAHPEIKSAILMSMERFAEHKLTNYTKSVKDIIEGEIKFYNSLKPNKAELHVLNNLLTQLNKL